MTPPKLMTVKEAAEYHGLSTERIGVLIRSGKIPAVRVGRAYAMSRADVVAWKPQPMGWKPGRKRKTKS